MKRKHILEISLSVAALALVIAFARPLFAWFTLEPLGGRTGRASSTTAGNLGLKVALQPDPPRQSGNALLVTLRGEDGKLIRDAAVQLSYVMPAMGAMPEMRGVADVRSDEQGHYRAAFDLPMAGTWTLELQATSSKGRATARYNMTVGNRGLVSVGAEEGAPAAAAPAARLSAGMVSRLRAVFAAYDDIRSELAADRLDAAKSKTPSLAAALRNAGNPEDKGLQNCVQASTDDAGKMANAGSLEEARAAFTNLGRLLIPLAASDPRLSQGFHLFTCPMTSGFNQWLQRAEQASNPYLGMSMPDCGTPTDWTKALAQEMKIGKDGVAYYTCSMHPNVRHVSPDKCPICSMNLVPVTAADIETGVIRIPETRRQEIGVRTALAEVKPLRLTVRAVGKTAYDETRVRDVTLKLDGWIEKLYVNETGQYVRKGQPLLALYSPNLYAAEQELLLALQSQAAAKGTGAPDRADYLVRAARERLKLLDLADAQIDRIASTGKAIERVPILSPYDGFVIEKDVFEGAAVNAGQRLYRLADLDRIWVEADVYESDLPQLALGQPVRVMLPYMPGTKLDGKIAYIYPYLNQQTRTGKVRIELPNAKLALKPEMYADVTLDIDRGPRLVIPVSAVVETGPRRIVFLDLGEGRLRPQEVELGLRSGDEYEVLKGVREGDRIVTSANFLISAESRIRSAESFWGGTK